jgi:hypothetical protein
MVGGQPRLLEPNQQTVPATDALIKRFELLSKIFGNVTTRSNTFAVWMTVGFFNVTNDQTQPVQLGSEYNWPGGQGPIRHKFFAIVDRSQLQVWPTNNLQGQAKVTSATTISLPVNAGPPPVPATSTKAAVSLLDAAGQPITGPGSPPPQNQPPLLNPVRNHFTNRTWTPGWLQAPAIAGTSLTFEPGTPYEETVIVDATGNATFYAQGQPRTDAMGNPYLHPAGCRVISRGNPGPWTQYDPANDQGVVPYAVRVN